MKRSAILLCRELWLWLSKNPTRDKRDFDWGPPDQHLKWWNLLFCPCCAYAHYHEPKHEPEKNCGSECLLRWPGEHCNTLRSPYYNWRKNSLHPHKRKRYALEVVKLCDQALEHLPSRKGTPES